MEKREKNITSYKSKLNNESERFKNWLGSCSRYLCNKNTRDIKYHG